jgi:EAL and modified HD-GYP domain-containing signal transduction protein
MEAMANAGNNRYIVRQPIKDAKGAILGYEILYHGANQAFSGDKGSESENDFAAADAIFNFLTENSQKSLKGSLNFMTFTTTLLMKKTPRLFDKSELVIQIDDSVIIHPLSMHFVKQFAQDGYKIAVNEFQFAPRYLALMDDIDYIKLNVHTANEMSMQNTIEIAHSMNKKCIVTNIENESEYQMAISLEADALEGSFVAQKLTTKAHSGSYLQSNFFRLMVAVTRDEPDVEEIEQIISTDAGLTYGLLRMANSAYYTTRARATTIKQAIVTLGITQLKQWIYLLSASGSNHEIEPETEAFLKLSFMRANFCSELMNYATNMPISKSEAYLMGMFSTLGYMVDAPLEEILGELPVSDEIRKALLNKEGRCGMLYDLVLAYEAADWTKIIDLAEQLGIPNNVLTTVYFVCVENVNELWEQLTHACPPSGGGAEAGAKPTDTPTQPE